MLDDSDFNNRNSNYGGQGGYGSYQQHGGNRGSRFGGSPERPPVGGSRFGGSSTGGESLLGDQGGYDKQGNMNARNAMAQQVHDAIYGQAPGRSDPAIRKMSIIRMVIIETGTYNPQPRRPFVVSDDSVNWSNMVDAMGGLNSYSPSTVGQAIGGFLTPSMAAEKTTNIDNGWDTPRLRWFMEVEYYFESGGMMNEVLTGWTSHVGVTPSGAFDPDMEFYINNVIQRRVRQVRTPDGLMVENNVVSADHLLANNDETDPYNDQYEVRMRPADVYQLLSNQQLSSRLPNLRDTRFIMTPIATKSRRSNGNPAHYVSQFMENYSNAAKMDQNRSFHEHMLTASQYASEKPANKDTFLAEVKKVRRDTFVGNHFCWNDIMAIQDTTTEITSVFLADNAMQARQSVHGQRQDLGARSIEAQSAAIIAYSLPSIMLDTGLLYMVGISTNEEIGKGHVTEFRNLSAFGEVDMRPYVSMIQSRIRYEILEQISQSNNLSYFLEYSINILGESIIKVSINGGPIYDYSIPSFSDALFSPVVTGNVRNASDLADNLGNLVETVMDRNGTSSLINRSHEGGSLLDDVPTFRMNI